MKKLMEIFSSRCGFKALKAGLLALVALGLLPVCPAAAVTQEEAMAIGVDAYIYGYPLVTMEMTRRVMTNVPKPEGTRAPMGQFVRMREYPRWRGSMCPRNHGCSASRT
jgi:hypothetical protein